MLGYEIGTLGVRPAFVYQAEDVARLVWNEQCTYNLVNYLRDKRGKKVAVVVKPCDSRALNILIHEGQVKREEVHVLGVACAGHDVEGRGRSRAAPSAPSTCPASTTTSSARSRPWPPRPMTTTTWPSSRP